MRKCIRCGKFGARTTRVIKLWENPPFYSNWEEYGEWWLVDNKKEIEAGFLRGIPAGPYGARHAAHANSTFVIEDFVPLCPSCGEDGQYVLLGGFVSRCDKCGKHRYGAGNDFSHICEKCLTPVEFDFTSCSCLTSENLPVVQNGEV